MQSLELAVTTRDAKMKRCPQYPRVLVVSRRIQDQNAARLGWRHGTRGRYSSGIIAAYRLLPAMSCIARTFEPTASASYPRILHDCLFY
jgi:hypothetical protein